MQSCAASYILRDCTCLADPLNFYSNICGYVNKQYGLVYPCDSGCCAGKCENKNPTTRDGVRPSHGVDLPAGYGVNIPHSDEPSETRGAADISAPMTLLPGGIQGPTPHPQYKVWQILLMAILPLLMVLVMACFLT